MRRPNYISAPSDPTLRPLVNQLNGLLNALGAYPFESIPRAGQLLIGTTDGSFVLNNLIAGVGVTITNDSGAITISQTIASGESNTASNVGVGGVGLFNSKVGVDLQFKNINAGSAKITVTDDPGNKEVDIDVSELNLNINNIGGTPLALNKGGTNNTIIADNGAIPYSDATKITLLGSTATANKVLMSGASAAPVWSTPTFPNASATSGKFIRSDGTNWIASTPTLPTSAGAAGKLLRSDGTNYVETTPTHPNTANTNKVLIGDGTNWVESTPTFPNASATSGKFIRSDGTNWIASTPTLPTSVGTSGKVLMSDATNYVESTATYPSSTTVSQILYSSATNVVGGLTTGNSGVVRTDSTGIPNVSVKTEGGWYYNLSIQKATTTNTNDSFKITSFDGTALSSTNSAWVDLPDPSNPGRTTRFTITADVTKKISGATWNIPGNITGAILRVSFANDNGTLRTCIAYQGNRTKLTTTDTNATATSITTPEGVLCDTAVGSATNSNRELGYVIADFTQATAVWAIETGVNAVVTGQSPDGIWQPYVITWAGFSANPTSVTSRWQQIGATITLCVDGTAGTSNATTMTMTGPVKASAAQNNQGPTGLVINNSAILTTPGLFQSTASSQTINVFKDTGAGTWTNAGTKIAKGNFSYEMGP